MDENTRIQSRARGSLTDSERENKMTYAIEIERMQRFEFVLDADSEDQAREMAREIATGIVRPETQVDEIDVQPMAYCDNCGEQHFGPVCKKPAQGERLIAPSWERARL